MKDPRKTLGKIGIIGAGGGFRGAAIPGFLKPLTEIFAEYNFLPHYLEAVSVSAPMLARLSEAKTSAELPELLDQTIKKWNYIEPRGPEFIFDWRLRKVHFWHSPGILDNDPLFWLVKDFRPELSINGPIPLDLCVFNDVTRKHQILSSRDPLFREHPEEWTKAVVASLSLRPIFSPEKVGDQFYYDGGFISLSRAIEAGCDTVFVLFPYPETYRKPKPSRMGGHFPFVDEISSAYAAVLRDRDGVEFVMADLANEKADLVGRLAEKDTQIESLEAQLAELQERLGAEASPGFSDRIAQLGIVRKLNNLVAWARKGPSDETAQQMPKKVNIIRLHGEPPPTLTLTEFAKGDFAKVRERAEKKMRAACEKLLT